MATFYSLHPSPKSEAEWRENLRVLSEFMKKALVSGNLGIGTADPGEALDVVGGARIRGAAGTVALAVDAGEVRFPPASGAPGNTHFNFGGDNKNYIRGVTALADNGGSVGIGTASPATSAKLEVASTTGAFLPPRMTTAERDALTAVNGMVLYNSTTDKLQVRAAGAWVDLH